MSINTQSHPLSGSAAAAHSAASAAQIVWRLCKRWSDALSAIDHLSTMTDAQLKDIGISRSEIEDVVWNGRESTGRHYWESRFW